jgi:hydroxymethylglutaryl-CoA lyase
MFDPTSKPLHLVECPRDAMQGWPHFIDTPTKISYINQLLHVGFDTIDCGSFVSPKAIPQMADTKDVLAKINMQNTNSKLLVIVANERGAQEAVTFEQVTYLGFPFSISETFQQANTNSSIAQSLHRVEAIQQLCINHHKQLVVYISMGFGNPYGDLYNAEIVLHWTNELQKLGVNIISIADTVGLATPANIQYLFKTLIPAYPALQFGAHFHTTADTWQQKIDAAYQNGCIRFDGAINGIGGCPMAQEELVGNMDTINLINYFKQYPYNKTAFTNAIQQSNIIFKNH